MKKDFSTSWKSSSQRRKQRKYKINAPIHIRKKFLSTNMSKELRKKHGIRNLVLRKGDKVKIMRGKFKKHIGEVFDVDVKETKVFVDGAQKIKKDGTKIFIPLNPSKLQLVEIKLDDKYRKEMIERRNKNAEKTPQKV